MNPIYQRLTTAVALLLLTVAAAGAAPAEGVVNVNTADEAQLALLPRVGPSLAGKIVQFREENGNFKSPEDLLLVSGIGEKTFELLEPFVTVTGETTLAAKIRVSDLRDTTGSRR